MTKEELVRLFVGDPEDENNEGPYDAEFLKFERIENKRSNRDDLHAFMLLDELVPLVREVPYSRDMVDASEHDQIWLSVDLDKLAAVITEEQVVELIRCGVHLDEDNDSLTLYT